MSYGRTRFMKDPQDAAHTKDLKGTLPAWVERTGDNYNHLFEQPIAFYVVTLAIASINSIDPLMMQLAWAFVILKNYSFFGSANFQLSINKIYDLPYWLVDNCLYGNFQLI